MAITIKKSKLTLKAPVADTPVVPEAGAEAVAEKEVVKSGPSTFQIVVLILVILSLGIYGTLFALQCMEWSFYHQPPTAFPEFVPSMAAAAPSAATPEAVPETLPATLTPSATTSAPAAASNAAPAAVTEPEKPKPARPARPSGVPEGV